MTRYLLPTALLAASLQAQEHHPLPPPPPPKGPQATCYWYSHQQDWWVYTHTPEYEQPLRIRVNGNLKSYTEATEVPLAQPRDKRPADSLADHFHDFRLVGDSRKDKIERIIAPPPPTEQRQIH